MTQKPTALSLLRGTTLTKYPAHSRAKKQCGVIAIEFVFSFIFLFIIFYGLAGYFLPFLLAASHQETASDALHAAIRDPHFSSYSQMAEPQQEGYLEQREALVRQAINSSWLPQNWRTPCNGRTSYLSIEDDVWSVCVGTATSDLIPSINLLGIEVPRLPDEIHGVAQIKATSSFVPNDN